MPRPSRRKPSAPLAAKERELAAEEHRIQCQIEELQRTLKEAPRLAAEEARQRRESLLSDRGAVRTAAGLGPQGKRYAGQRASGRCRPLLKAERHAARLQTLALCVALIAVLFWVASHFL